MDMGVMMQVLSPGVQNRDDTDLGTQVAWVGGDRAQRLGGRPEQDGIDRRLVVEGDLGHRGRHREHDVEVRNRQQLGLPLRQPLGASQALLWQCRLRHEL
jgi:hypothetical protein